MALILASGSPRRKQLLEDAGIAFKAVPSTYEEDMTLPLPPHELAMHLAKGKAEEVGTRVQGTILGIDTFICLGTEILGKPHTKERAVQTLQKLSGKTVDVYSGVAIINNQEPTRKNHVVTTYQRTSITFRPLSDEEIERYVSTGEALDKAGAFAIQGKGRTLIKEVHGCLNNVVGLPISVVLELLGTSQ